MTALIARPSIYFDLGGQFAVDEVPPVVIDDPIIVPCTAALPQPASTLMDPPPSPLFDESK
jgi:hypothetical protein